MLRVFEPQIEELDVQLAVDALNSGEVSGAGGRYIDRFEEEFSAYCGASCGVATTSGTTALHLALAALGIGPGDEVIVPALTNIATAYAVVYCGATPVVVDCDPETGNMDPALAVAAMTPRTRAIVPVHLYGHPVDMDPLLELRTRHGVRIIEDAAEAHGAEYRGRRVGGIGDIGCFSFYANKVITTGEGGMVVTSDENVAAHARLLKDLAFTKSRRFLHEYIGFNYRMTNLQAALGVAQLARIDRVLADKRRVALRYSELLAGCRGLRRPVERSWARNIFWMYAVVVERDFGMSRDQLANALAARGIETRPFFVPMNVQPAFRKMGLFVGQRCPVAEDLADRGLYLPSSPALTDDQLIAVVEAVIEAEQVATGASLA